MDASEKVFVAGHRGLVGRAIVRQLEGAGHTNIATRSRSELDLADRRAVDLFYAAERPAVVIDAAARVGGIKANYDEPVEFLLENLTIQNNLIRGAHEAGVRKLLFLGSSCIYPKHAAQPIREDALLTGPLEPSNRAYAIAKIAGVELCQSYARQYGDNFISVMPTNLYGPHDNFDVDRSHVLPALIRKAHDAKSRGNSQLTIWGTGTPRRELLHVDDMAAACLFLLKDYDSPEIINVGYGEDFTVRELAELVCEVVGFSGQLVYDQSKPDGTPRKHLDITKLKALGWSPRISLREGIAETYRWFLANLAGAK